MRLGDVKNVTANRGYIKLMLHLKLVVPGSSYFSFINIVSPSPVPCPSPSSVAVARHI